MEKLFPRSVDALSELVSFTRGFFENESVPEAHRYSIDFAIEEIFTNFLKYHPTAKGEILVRIERAGDEVRVVLTDRDVDRFDPTLAPDADTSKPIEERRAGGLGLHLTRRLMDRIEYAYSPDERASTITMTKSLGVGHVPGDTR